MKFSHILNSRFNFGTVARGEKKDTEEQNTGKETAELKRDTCVEILRFRLILDFGNFECEIEESKNLEGV